MSNPPPRKSRRVQARRRRGARGDVAPGETSGVTPGTASERPHSVPTQPMVQGSVEPPTVGTLPGQSSMEDFMRGVSKAVEAGIQAAISPLLQLTSQQGAGNLSSSPPAGRQNAEDMPLPPATSGGPQTGAVGCTATKGLPAVGRETLPPAPLVQHIPLSTVGCTGEGVYNSDGNGSSNGGGQGDKQLPEVVGQQGTVWRSPEAVAQQGTSASQSQVGAVARIPLDRTVSCTVAPGTPGGGGVITSNSGGSQGDHQFTEVMQQQGASAPQHQTGTITRYPPGGTVSCTVTPANQGATSIASEINVASTSLISGISDALRVKIWEQKYVELSNLLYKQDTTVRVGVSSQDEGPEFMLNQRPSGTIKSVEEWDQAYAKYHAIFIRRHHHLSEALIGHQQQVRKIARSGGDWRGYDESYRRGVADDSIAWGQMNPGLLIDAMLFSSQRDSFRSKSVSQNKRQGSSGAKGRFIPRGYCIALHKRGKCEKEDCQWNHKCPQCNRNHPLPHCKEEHPSRGGAGRGSRSGQGGQ